jgi:hypothetical protein
VDPNSAPLRAGSTGTPSDQRTAFGLTHNPRETGVRPLTCLQLHTWCGVLMAIRRWGDIGGDWGEMGAVVVEKHRAVFSAPVASLRRRMSQKYTKYTCGGPSNPSRARCAISAAWSQVGDRRSNSGRVAIAIAFASHAARDLALTLGPQSNIDGR